jgi:hypothetical protein
VTAKARTARRTVRAALTAGQALVTAVRGHRFRLLVTLYRAIDTRQTVRIRYVDRDGVVSIRDITPHRLDPTSAGHITCRAHDSRDAEDTTFRTDRMTILNPSQEAPMQLQTCRRHPSAGRFMATCSGCTRELYAIEQANRAHAAAERAAAVRAARIADLRERIARRALATISAPTDARILHIVRTGTVITVATHQPDAYLPYCVDSFRLLTPAEKDPEVYDADEITDFTLTDQYGGYGPDEIPTLLAHATAYAA